MNLPILVIAGTMEAARQAASDRGFKRGEWVYADSQQMLRGYEIIGVLLGWDAARCPSYSIVEDLDKRGRIRWL